MVRKYHKHHDVQKVYSELQAFAITSTAASLNVADLLTYITIARLGAKQTWVGSTSAFITHWENQVRQYNLTVPIADDRLSKATMLTLLQSAVHGISELWIVKEQSQPGTNV